MVSGIPMAAKVTCIIYNEEWTGPSLSLHAPTFQPHLMPVDPVIWDGSSSYKYQVSHACNVLRIHYPLVTWQKIV